ncbi:hypothetical protein JFV29_12355 [Peribacillus sp. TH16]|uniref:hypothetical protein n=1 Tax=Peribacillus sp. TH16 TaxID=2798482 RepID=UPI001914441A|nr:hypothetical protein [Peribacillus sp. TH16]MBK5482675.1 hypothetical protein [Peribacillus sp. TH16]
MDLELFQIVKGVSEEQLHSKFKLLKESITMKDERDILLGWTEGFVDRDKKIVREFQETFHSSFWEFYLNACFNEMGFKLEQSYNRPDFIITSPYKIYVEAVVSNIKKGGREEKDRDINDLMEMFNPPSQQPDFVEVLDEAIIRHSNTITYKINKHFQEYSKCEWIEEDVPFVVAMSSYDQVNYGREYIYPMMALLYGLYYVPEENHYIKKDTVVKPETGAKIPIGIFNSDKYSNISAIIYSCTTTLGKLASLALSSGKSSTNIVYNLRRDYEDNDIPYKLQVVDKEVPELLTDGLFIFHNPYAKNKLDISCFEETNITQYFIEEGEVFFTSNTSPIVTRLNIPRLMQPGFETLIQEYLRQYNNVSPLDFYNVSYPQEETINFDIMCRVCIIAKIPGEIQPAIFYYDRPQLVPDDVLTREALEHFAEMRDDKTENIEELISIYIARTEEQFNSLGFK